MFSNITFYNGASKDADASKLLLQLNEFLLAELRPTKVIYVVGNDQFVNLPAIDSNAQLTSLRRATEFLIAKLVG